MFNKSGIKEFRDSIPEHFRARRSNFFIFLGTLIFGFYGWKIEGSLLTNKRVIILAAPHTSYEDFVRGLLVIFSGILSAPGIPLSIMKGLKASIAFGSS